MKTRIQVNLDALTVLDRTAGRACVRVDDRPVVVTPTFVLPAEEAP